MLFEKVSFLVLAGPKRVEVLKQKYPELANEIDYLAGADPSGGKQKYLQWEVNQLRKGLPEGWELHELAYVVLYFTQYMDRIKEKDINKYKSVVDLDEVVTSAMDEEEVEEKETTNPPLIYDKGGMKIWRMETRAQMCRAGTGSGWCVADPDSSYHWDSYTEGEGRRLWVVDWVRSKFLVFVYNGRLQEIKDYSNEETEETGELAEELERLELVRDIDSDVQRGDDPEEVRRYVLENETEDWQSETVPDLMDIAEDLFDEFMRRADETTAYRDEHWGEAEKVISQRLRDLPFDATWEVEVENETSFEDAYGYFPEKPAEEDYEKFVLEYVTDYLEDEMDWLGEGEAYNRSKNFEWKGHEYERPWNKLLEKASRVARVILAEGVTVPDMAKAMSFGKKLPDAIYVHKRGLPGMPEELQAMVEEAEPHVGEYELLKVFKKANKISFLSYPEFDTDPHPALAMATTYDFDTGQAKARAYARSKNRPILHRKETFLPPGDGDIAEYAALTQQEERAGLYEVKNRIGFEKFWNELLASKGLGYDDHVLIELETGGSRSVARGVVNR